MKILFVANWNLYCDYDKTLELTKFLSSIESEYEMIVAPATPFLSDVAKLWPGHLAAQYFGNFTEGAHTGMTSLLDQKAVGASYVIIGHSESRAAGETEEDIRTKIALAREYGMTPIFCVGELRESHMNGESKKVLGAQLESLGENFSNVIIAYEPVWAISAGGIGESAGSGDIIEMHTHIKKITGDARVIYGGSVNSKNFEEIISLHSVDGVLVGFASTSIPELKNMLVTTP